MLYEKYETVNKGRKMSNTTKIVAAAVVVAAIGAGAFILLGKGGSNGSQSAASEALEINFNSYLSQAITKWEFSPAGQDAFVALALSDGVLDLAENEMHQVADTTATCIYDMRVTKADGTSATLLGRNLCDSTFFTYYDEYPITFVNGTEHDFINVVASPNVGSGGVSHGFKLPEGGFKSGATINFAIPLVENSCAYGYQFNIRMATPADAVVVEVKDVDLCEKWNGQIIDLTPG